MSTEKKPEDLIKDKLDSRGFAFDEKAWAGMESLLDGQEKNKKRAFLWYFSASMFVVLVAGAALYWNVEKQESRVKSQESEVGSQQSSVVPQVAQVSQESHISSGQSEVSNTNSKVISPESRQKSKGVSEKSAIKVVPVSNKDQKSDGGNKELAVDGSQSAVGSQQLAVNPTELESAQAAQVPLVPQDSKPEAVIPEEATNQTPEIIPVPEAEQASLDTTKTQESTPEPEKQNPLAAPGKETKNAWGIVAGAGVWMPYKSTSEEVSNKGMIGFTGGIYYQGALSKRFDIGVSALYSRRGATNLDKTFSLSEFGFGIQSDKTIVSPKAMHYLSVPLYVRLNVSPRSHFILGAAYYRLLATTYKTEHITENSFGVLEYSSEKETGEHAGFRKYDVSAFLGYELTLFSGFHTALQFNYGFYDITNNSYSGMSTADKNISLQLQLKYDLLTH